MSEKKNGKVTTVNIEFPIRHDKIIKYLNEKFHDNYGGIPARIDEILRRIVSDHFYDGYWDKQGDNINKKIKFQLDSEIRDMFRSEVNSVMNDLNIKKFVRDEIEMYLKDIILPLVKDQVQKIGDKNA